MQDSNIEWMSQWAYSIRPQENLIILNCLTNMLQLLSMSFKESKISQSDPPHPVTIK
jgi:hypothetical protein